MKAYGLIRLNAGETDVSGCIGNGRASAVAHLSCRGGKAPTFRALREGKKAAIRRRIKRVARAEGKSLCTVET